MRGSETDIINPSLNAGKLGRLLKAATTSCDQRSLHTQGLALEPFVVLRGFLDTELPFHEGLAQGLRHIVR